MHYRHLSARTLDIEDLLLDPNNPRFWGDFPLATTHEPISAPNTQERIRRHAIQQHGVTQLIESICRIGLLSTSTIIVKPYHDKFLVVEGNRRIAAAKTILGDVKRKTLSVNYNIFRSINTINAHIVNDDYEINPILIQGIYHVSGTKSWGPYQKANILFRLTTDHNINIRDSAAIIGINHSRAKSLIHGFYGLNQFASTLPHGNNISQYFSHFEVAFNKIPIREWLNWCEEDKCYLDFHALRFFYQSICPPYTGFVSTLTARHIRDCLPLVLQHPEARNAYLSGEVPINTAFAMSQPQSTQLRSFLDNATSLIRQMKTDPSPVNLSAKDLKTLAKLHALTGNLLQQQNQTE